MQDERSARVKNLGYLGMLQVWVQVFGGASVGSYGLGRDLSWIPLPPSLHWVPFTKRLMEDLAAPGFPKSLYFQGLKVLGVVEALFHLPQSKLLVSPLTTTIILPSIVPYITPLRYTKSQSQC